MSKTIIGKDVPKEMEKHAVAHIKRRMKQYIEDELQRNLTIYTPQAGQFGVAGRPDLEFTMGEYALTIYTEMKSPKGKPSGKQLEWISTHNNKHPMAPAVIIYGKAGVDKFMDELVRNYFSGSSLRDWYDWCELLIKEPVFK